MQTVNNLFSNFSDKQINYNALNELLNHEVKPLKEFFKDITVNNLKQQIN